MGIYCVSCTNIFSFLALTSFFLFGPQFPGMFRRFGAEVPTSCGFVALGSFPSHRLLRRATLLDAFVAAAVAPIGCFLNGDTFLAASVDAYTIGGGLHRAFSFSPPF